MSSDRNSPTLPAASQSGRRASITDYFYTPRSGSLSSQSGGYSGPITSAAASAQRRRLSLSTATFPAGGGSSQSQGVRPRGESLSSSSGSIDESPFDDDPAPLPSSANSNPVSPFARRLSFGARALRDVRQGSGSGGNTNGRSSIRKASAPTAQGRGETYNFAENMRTRAERTSVSGANAVRGPEKTHARTKSVPVMEPPVREMPKQPRVPDAMQERILKGDFYMD